MKKRVIVTQRDIDNGYQGIFAGCPVALASRRAFPGKSISVGPRIIIIDGFSFPMPDKALRFIADFYCGKHVSPFQFTLK